MDEKDLRENTQEPEMNQIINDAEGFDDDEISGHEEPLEKAEEAKSGRVSKQKLRRRGKDKEPVPAVEEDDYAGMRTKRLPGKARGKRRLFNGVDIAIVSLVVLVLVFVILHFNPFTWLFGTRVQTRAIDYTVVISNVDDVYSASVKEGDTVYQLNNTGLLLGRVINEVVVDDYTVLTAREGVAELTTYGSRVSLTIVIRLDAAQYEPGKGYSIDGQRIAVGTTLQLNFPGFSAEGVVVNLNRVS